MSFHEQNFQTRFAAMGDEAEHVFETVVDGKFHRLGLNRPPFYMGDLTKPMCYTPDYMTRLAFVEVMGFGRDKRIKLKDEKMQALVEWTHLGPVDLFFWWRTEKVWWQEPIEVWQKHFETFGEPGSFREGKTFKALHVNNFPDTAKAFHELGNPDGPHQA